MPRPGHGSRRLPGLGRVVQRGRRGERRGPGVRLRRVRDGGRHRAGRRLRLPAHDQRLLRQDLLRPRRRLRGALSGEEDLPGECASPDDIACKQWSQVASGVCGVGDLCLHGPGRLLMRRDGTSFVATSPRAPCAPAPRPARSRRRIERPGLVEPRDALAPLSCAARLERPRADRRGLVCPCWPPPAHQDDAASPRGSPARSPS